jgi:plastocyanin
MLTTLLGAALLAGCGDDDKTGLGGDAAPKTTSTAVAKPAGATTSIRIVDFIYEPDPATVKAGEMVTIANADKAPHTLTEEGGSPSFDSDTIKGGQQGSVTFSKPGTFKYFCAFHATMKGTVTVTR